VAKGVEDALNCEYDGKKRQYEEGIEADYLWNYKYTQELICKVEKH
jgi:hypothetical protein